MLKIACNINLTPTDLQYLLFPSFSPVLNQKLVMCSNRLVENLVDILSFKFEKKFGNAEKLNNLTLFGFQNSFTQKFSFNFANR